MLSLRGLFFFLRRPLSFPIILTAASNLPKIPKAGRCTIPHVLFVAYRNAGHEWIATPKPSPVRMVCGIPIIFITALRRQDPSASNAAGAVAFLVLLSADYGQLLQTIPFDLAARKGGTRKCDHGVVKMNT